MSNNFTVLIDVCELCASEYVSRETEKLKSMPDNQKKTQEIHRIMHAARKAATKLCVRIACREQRYDNFAYHNFCIDHSLEMTASILEAMGE